MRPGGRGDGGGYGRTPSMSSDRASSWSGSRSPQSSFSGPRTPAYSPGSKTPAWLSSNDGSRTPGYFPGSKTPAYGMDGSRSSYAGNKTPA